MYVFVIARVYMMLHPCHLFRCVEKCMSYIARSFKREGKEKNIFESPGYDFAVAGWISRCIFAQKEEHEPRFYPMNSSIRLLSKT